MIIVSVSQFHVYLPWGQRLFSIVSYSIVGAFNLQKALGGALCMSVKKIQRNLQRSSFQALVASRPVLMAAARRCGRHGGGWCRQSTLHSTQHKLKHNTDTTQVMKSARYIRNSCKTLHKIVPCFALVTFPGNRKWLTHSHHFTKFVTLNC